MTTSQPQPQETLIREVTTDRFFRDLDAVITRVEGDADLEVTLLYRFANGSTDFLPLGYSRKHGAHIPLCRTADKVANFDTGNVEMVMALRNKRLARCCVSLFGYKREMKP
jgi:hypothetical protein